MSIKTRKSSAFSFSAKARRHHPSFDKTQLQGWKMMHKEAELPHAGWDAEEKRCLELGLQGADSIQDKSIPTFARGELPHFAGINTFMKAPYIENMKDVGKFDVAVMGVPFDGGTTYRPGTRFRPQGISRISALYTPYNYEIGVDLREQMSLCDIGDVFTIPANIEKTFDQISKATAHVFASGAMPIILGGDHSIGFPTVCGIASQTDKKIGIIHFDRHADIQEKDLDERMHTTPWFHHQPAQCARDQSGADRHRRLASAAASSERSTQVRHHHHYYERRQKARPRQGRRNRARNGVERLRRGVSEFRHRLRRRGLCAWPEPGGFLPREVLYLLGLVAKEGICGTEVVEVSPPYDISDITSAMAALFGPSLGDMTVNIRTAPAVDGDARDRRYAGHGGRARQDGFAPPMIRGWSG